MAHHLAKECRVQSQNGSSLRPLGLVIMGDMALSLSIPHPVAE
jgi:hypothetical protein